MLARKTYWRKILIVSLLLLTMIRFNEIKSLYYLYF